MCVYVCVFYIMNGEINVNLFYNNVCICLSKNIFYSKKNAYIFNYNIFSTRKVNLVVTLWELNGKLFIHLLIIWKKN